MLNPITKQQRILLVLLSSLLLFSCSDSYRPTIGKGDTVPASNNRLVEAGGNWRDICSMDIPDRLHKWKISDLRSAGKPFLVVFGTPQHCTMCVDQLVRVATLQEKYGDRFAVLHVDGYRDNAVWVEWGIKGEPWTFIVDGKGVVREVFPGPTDVFLMENEIRKILKENS